LVDVHLGAQDKPTNMFIHGMPGAASGLRRVMEPKIDAGESVKAFVYDNKFRSLEDSSRDLAEALRQWMHDHPGQPLRLTAHSAGGRVTLAALALLGDGWLTRDIEVNLIASPLAGVRSATFARLAPGFLPWIRPLRGISPRSRVQKTIDQLQLPDNVRVYVHVGDKDSIVNHSTKRYTDLVRRLRATVTVFANATHTSILDQASSP
jgi:pimeloyl-ACP methyl ester carboxylesterase